MPVRFSITLPAVVFAVLAPLCSKDAQAQPEIVPTEHRIYDFLHAQRVAGRLPLYRHEALPLDRKTLQHHLDTLQDVQPELSGPSQYWLNEFRRELFEPEHLREQLIGTDGSIELPSGANTEKFLFYHSSDDWRIAISATGIAQFRAAEDSASYRGMALVPEGTAQGNYRNLIGFYSSTFNGNQFGGDTRVLKRDPVLAPLYYIDRLEQPAGSFDRSTASFRIANENLSAEIAHERLRLGPAFGQPLLVSNNADYFSFVKLGLDTRVVQYQFLHGALGERSTNPLHPDGFILTAPERYLAMHRITLQPIPQAQFSFTEAVVYGLRGPELAYLNPFFPIKPAEHALWDRDNSLFTLDTTIRPFKGIEVFGAYLVDDLKFDEIGQNSYHYKWAAQGGIAASLDPVIAGTTGYVEYTRVEPFTYTHRFELDGSFYNSYLHNGYGLGHPLGPNSDQIEAGLSVWLPFRAHARVSGRYVRRGENFIDEDGQLVNVGGDILDGTQPPFTEFSKVFLSGDLYKGAGVSVDVTVEPIRGVAFRLFGDYQRWDRDDNELFVRGELRVTI
ncbi:MAG: capsule assembly Wzi family protein [Rubricoccaceae bacterium]|nr:capsule assembly Wzi family protein [Rubricoccaceae bacterium]